MTVRVYKSTDTSAPQFSSTAVGTLIPILDACLVTGYGTTTPAGWTKEYSGTNKAAYKQGTGSNGFYLRVDDSVHANYVRTRAYESMTDIDTGTNPFPTVAQLSGGFYWAKNSTINVGWVVVATENAFYFWTQYSTTPNSDSVFFFGDIESYISGDAFNTVIIGSISAAGGADSINYMSSTLSSYQNAYIARDYTQTTLSPGCPRIVNPAHVGNYSQSVNTFYHPYDLTTGNIRLYQMFATEISGTLRGKFPGIYGIPSTGPYGSLTGKAFDVVGSGSETGKSFVMVSSNARYYLLETSDNW